MNQCENLVITSLAVDRVVITPPKENVLAGAESSSIVVAGVGTSTISVVLVSDGVVLSDVPVFRSTAFAADRVSLATTTKITARDSVRVAESPRSGIRVSSIDAVKVVEGWDGSAVPPTFCSVGVSSDKVSMSIYARTSSSAAVADSYTPRGVKLASAEGVARDSAVTYVGSSLVVGSTGEAVDRVECSAVVSGRLSASAAATTGVLFRLDASISVGCTAAASDSLEFSGLAVVSPIMSQFNGGVSFANLAGSRSVLVLGGKTYFLGPGGAYLLGDGADVIVDTGFQKLGSPARKRASSVYISGKTSEGEGSISIFSDESSERPTTHPLIDRGGVGPRVERFRVGKGSTGVYWRSVLKYKGKYFSMDSLSIDAVSSNRRVR